ncbi:EAL domain-containing protein [Pseudoalteromonas sp.]|uniref:bifunctional diguanylate cyclase/phosphodiesterase n=1 Tax=Pseudoalteromonas sp. TaxID=53249 RepID=UPI001BCE4F8C|nr:EAL domain-containing protein [Pseudoalteromonas sp.]
MLVCIPVVAVILVTLWFSRDAAIKEHEKKVQDLTKHLIFKQQSMLDDVRRATIFLAKKQSSIETITSSCPSHIFDIKTLNGNIANIGIVDKNGNVLCTTKNNTTHINISDRPYFQSTLTNKGFSIGHFQHDRSLSAQSINFAYPILNKNNNIEGVVVTVIALDWWSSALNTIKLPKGVRAVITDSDGRIVANHPVSTDRLGQQLKEHDLAHNQKQTQIYKSKDGISRIFHRATLYRDDNTNQLSIFITQPVTQSLEQIDIQFLRMVLVFLLSIIVLATLTKRLVNKSILSPIENLTSAINRLAAGNMPHHDEQPNSPELNELYHCFKYMAKTRLNAEAQLQHKHDELNSLLNALPDAFLRVDTSGTILDCGGYIGALNSNNLTPPQKLSCLLDTTNLKQIKSYLKPIAEPIVIELESKQNNQFFEAKISPMKKNNEFVVVISNITQRKQNQESLHLASLVYNNSSEGMAITDKDGIIYDVNPAFCKTTFYSKNEVINQTVGILSSGKHDKQFYDYMWQSLNTTGRWQGEITNRRKNGELYVEWLTIDTIYDKNKVPTSRIAIFTDLTEKKQADELIWRQAHFDHLTDLPNRLELKERLNQRFTNLTSDDQTLVIMLLDIDHFKDINDTLGHHYGDRLLKLVSERIVFTAKEADFVARIGGDEFVVVFSNLHGSENIKQMANSLLFSLASTIFIEEEKVYISASIGIACAPDDGQSPEQLLKAADQAMYKAKNSGRNGFEFFSQDMREDANARMQLLKELRSAIELAQFELYYQPIVSLDSLHIHKAEGLIRWQHPEKGLISPADFIPLAEETRQINALGQFVFAEALQTLNDIKKHIQDEFQISINVSPVQLATVDSGIDEWSRMLASANIPASAIVAEITEGLMVNPEELTQSRLKALVKSGMQLALDDFGTGYSSLAYLQEMDTDYLKIDKRFVDNIQKGSQELALCEAIIMMAHQLGLKVIAEGIETKLQMDLLLEAGCDYGQGYLFSKPLHKASFMQLITTNQVISLK